MKPGFFQYSILLVAAALLTCSQSSFAQKALINKEFRLSSMHVTPQGPVFMYPDDQTASNNDSGCNPDGIAISRSKPNFNELYSLAVAAMLAGKKLLISSGDFDTAVCFEYGRATTNSIRIVN